MSRPEDHPRWGFIDGPRHTTTKRRIDFFYDRDPVDPIPFEEQMEVMRTRQRWVLATYGKGAFEEAPILEPYTEFDFIGYRHEIKESARPSVEIFLDQLEATHSTRHYVRRRPWCPGCRGDRLAALASLASYLGRQGNTRMPHDPSDDELNWDTDIVIEDTQTPQPELYLNRVGLRDMPAPKDLIEGILPRHGVGYITGRDRSLKTFLALDMALNTAFQSSYWHYAHPLHAPTPRATRRRNRFERQGKIIFAAGEGVFSFLPRIEAWVQDQHIQHSGANAIQTADGAKSIRVDGCARCAGEENPDTGHAWHPELDDTGEPFIAPGWGQFEESNFLIRKGVVNLHKGGHDYLFLLAKARAERPDMIVIDTLALASGAADQQAATDMGQVHENARRLADASGGVVVIIAHTDKGDHDARGSSVIEDNADFVLHCVREENDLLEVEVAKRKDAPDGWKFALGVTEVELDELGTTSLILHDYTGDHYSHSDDDELLDTRSRSMKAAEAYVLASGKNRFDYENVLSEYPKGPRGGVGVKRHEITTALDKEAAEGKLVVVEEGGGAGHKRVWGMPQAWVTWQKSVNPHLYTQITGEVPE